MASTHDGQCRLTMKQVVVTVVRRGLCFMVVGSVDMVCGIVVSVVISWVYGRCRVGKLESCGKEPW